MKFRKKPVVIDAVPVTHLISDAAHNWHALPDWFRDAYEAGNLVIAPGGISIKTLEGTMMADLGDILIRGIKGELYPCKPDIFAATYEPV
jgi:hypothetical protein